MGIKELTQNEDGGGVTIALLESIGPPIFSYVSVISWIKNVGVAALASFIPGL